MLGPRRRAWVVILVVLAGLSVFAWVGCDSVEPMGPDTTAPTGTRVTNPLEGSALNSSQINIRGRAEVGATISILVDDVSAGSAVASPAIPDDGELGRFTVEDVDLGEFDGLKSIKVITTDLYGNVTNEPIEIEILLDTVAPPLTFETIDQAEFDEVELYWLSGVPRVRVVATTDTLAAGAHVRHGVQEYLPDSTDIFPGEPGEPDGMRFWVTLSTPPLTSDAPESLITYAVEAFDAAGNVAAVPIDILWSADGKDTTLTWLEIETPISFDDYVKEAVGTKMATKFQAPPWANYVIGVRFFIGNDGDNSGNPPETPTTEPFTVWVWRPAGTMPGVEANDGANTGSQYPEMEWLQKLLPNAVDISNNSQFPNKEFFVGMEWDTRHNPWLGIDMTADAVDCKSWRYARVDTTDPVWEIVESHDVMIEAIVSDIPNITEGRTAIVGAKARARRITQ